MSLATRLILAYSGVILIWASSPMAIQWGALETGFDFAVMARMVIGTCCALIIIGLFLVRGVFNWGRGLLFGHGTHGCFGATF